MINNFICPECGSTKIKSIMKTNNVNVNGPYSKVNEEIQCGNCFMDIPTNLFSISNENNPKDINISWNKIYKPEHLKNAAKCSKCSLFYWEIEQYLNKNKIEGTDIFYQSYNIHGDGGNLVCKICDPNSFKK